MKRLFLVEYKIKEGPFEHSMFYARNIRQVYNQFYRTYLHDCIIIEVREVRLPYKLTVVQE